MNNWFAGWIIDCSSFYFIKKDTESWLKHVLYTVSYRHYTDYSVCELQNTVVEYTRNLLIIINQEVQQYYTLYPIDHGTCLLILVTTLKFSKIFVKFIYWVTKIWKDFYCLTSDNYE